MRRILFIAASTLVMRADAQNFPFATSDATWVQYFETMVTPPPFPQFAWTSTANFCMDGSDTLIIGTNYTRLQQCNAGYVGGIREEDGAVYFFPADSTQEYLLYDFGAAVGDTIFGVYVNEFLATGNQGWQEPVLLDVVVSASAPSSAYGGRVAVQVQAADPGWGLDSEWIEGMGCVHGLFTFNPLNVSNYWYGLDCFSHNDTTYWNGWYVESPGDCVPQYVGIGEHQRTRTHAFPNPTCGFVRVEGLDARRALEVRDALGRSVQVPWTRVSNEIVDLDLSALPHGMYTAQDGNGHTVRLGRD